MKKKISAFEYAIMQIADPEAAKDHQPFTKEEEEKQRIEKLRGQAASMKVITNESAKNKNNQQ
jgi:hypothetical protein